MNISQLRQELNKEQFKAVSTIDGPLLIIAGAGSGKTRVITYRIAHMLEKGIPQSQILALTFTNKAAKEMAERVKEQTNKKLQNLTVSTFHAFGVKVLRNDIDKLGWRTNFSIYDDVDRNQLIKDTGRELGFTQDALDIYKIGGLFSNIKCGRWNWESSNDMYRELYRGYQEGLQLFNAVDFDDLIGLPIRLFREHPEVTQKYRDRYKYLMVDEFQDTSLQQYELMKLLAHENIAVVGDDDQSIYSWRGANYENILTFEKDFPKVVEIRLEQNYRSTETILAAANGVIAHNTNRKDKALWSGNGSGKPIEIYMPDNEAAEADFITETIQSLSMSERRNYDDFGVLIRANTLTRHIEESFLESNIPYTMSGGTSFFQRKEIKDIISYLRVCSNHDDDVNLLRIINTPRRGIGRKAIEALNTVANQRECSLWNAIEVILKERRGERSSEDEITSQKQEHAPFDLFGTIQPLYASLLGAKALDSIEEFHDLILEQRLALLKAGKGLSKRVKALVDEINYWDFLQMEYKKSEKAARFKMMNIESLCNSIEMWENNPDNFDTGLYSYLNRITLLSRDDMEDASLKGKVNLMTIHASKGLEFPVVFIAGCEEGIIPHARSIEENPLNVEEERRLFYVAITRARDKLYISACQKRRKMQNTVDCIPSPFLDEIPQQLVQYHEPQTEIDANTAIDIFSQMKAKFSSPKDN